MRKLLEDGTVSPFWIKRNEILQIADESILSLNELYFGSGNHSKLIKLSLSDFLNAFQGKFEFVSI